jgi:hypothetical protein
LDTFEPFANSTGVLVSILSIFSPFLNPISFFSSFAGSIEATKLTPFLNSVLTFSASLGCSVVAVAFDDPNRIKFL